MPERGGSSDFHPHKKNQGGNRIFDNTGEVDQAPRNRPKSRNERISRKSQKQESKPKNRKKPGRRQR